MMSRHTLEKAFSAALATRTRLLGDEGAEHWSFEDEDVLPELDGDYDPEVQLAVATAGQDLAGDE
jgi:hypothetical protein